MSSYVSNSNYSLTLQDVPSGLEPNHILLVDDDEEYRKILELRLRGLFPGVRSVGCRTVADALGALAPGHTFDLVIIDHHLPDGISNDILNSGKTDDTIVLIMSADESPELPGQAIQAGATFFLSKRDLSQPLLRPLICGMLERSALRKQLQLAAIDQAITQTVRTLLTTLKHEIHNPLGVGLGSLHFITSASSESISPETAEAMHASAVRIKEVIQKLCEEVDKGTLHTVTKSGRTVFAVDSLISSK